MKTQKKNVKLNCSIAVDKGEDRRQNREEKNVTSTGRGGIAEKQTKKSLSIRKKTVFRLLKD